MIEEWRDIAGYDGRYKISNIGRVKCMARPRSRNGDKILRNIPNQGGYLRIMLSKSRETKIHWVHRLVANAFIPNPNKYPIINHLDCNPNNNRVENLEWCTHKMNSEHARAAGRYIGPGRLLSDEQVLKMRAERLAGVKQSVLAKKYMVNRDVVYAVIKRRNYNNV